MTIRIRPLLRASAGALLCVALLASGCRKDASKPGDGKKDAKAKGAETPSVKKDAPFLSPVLVKVSKRGEIRATVPCTGSIVPFRTQPIRTEEAGRLRFEKPWREGERVKKGDVIARIESATLVRELELTKADVDLQKEAIDIGERTLRARQRDYETLQDLYARGIAAAKEVDAARLELDRSKNNARQNRINLEKAEVRVQEIVLRQETCILRAPFDGILVSRATLEGQGKFTRGFGSENIADYSDIQVGTGHNVCAVADIDRVLMRCDVTSKDISSVQLGQEATVTVFAREGTEATGTVARISENVNPDTRAFEVDIELPNPDGILKPAMFGRTEIVTHRRQDAIRLPKSAITRRNNKDVVFLAQRAPDADFDIARMVPVELGLEGKDEIEITFGVKEGDRVVIRGFEVLQDSTPIKAMDVDAPVTPDKPVTLGSGS